MVTNRFESRSARVYENLRDMILTGSLAPGQKLTIREMSAKQGTSNGPIRDALLQLSNERLVERGYGVEWSVVQPTREMIDGGMVVREALEVQSARLCAELAGPEDLERLRGLGQQVDSAVEQELMAELDGRLHMGIAEVSGSQPLREELERWKIVMDWAGLYIKRRRRQGNGVQGDSHVELIEAIATGDADFAERQMRRHVHHPWDDIKWLEEETSDVESTGVRSK